MTADVLERLALAAAGVSFLYRPPDWEGSAGLGIPGLSSAPRPAPWQVVVSAEAPLMPGDDVRFVVAADGQATADEDVPAPALAPLAGAVAKELDPPFCAVAVRDEGDVWAAAANRAQIVELADAGGDEIEVSLVGGELATRVDGSDTDWRFPALEALAEREHADAAVVAHRFTGSTWVAEVFPL